jgi:hypothetical protein
MSGLWRNEDGTREGKYLVQRRDGTIPEWPYFVIAAKDPAAPAALRAYADAAEVYGMDTKYVSDLRKLADEFEDYRHIYGEGDPDAPPHRKDNPDIIEKMRTGKSF